MLGLAGFGCTGGGDTVISGLGNSGNRIGDTPLSELLADELVDHPATPMVTDDEIVQIYQVIRKNAFGGDVESALIVAKLAMEQREAEEE